MLDPKTVILLGFIFTIFSSVAIVYYLIDQKLKRKATLFFSIGHLFAVLTAGLYVFTKEYTPFIMSLSAWFAFNSVMLECYGLLYVNKKGSNTIILSLISYTVFFCILYSIYSSDVITRVLIASIYHMSIFSYFGYQLIFGKRNTKTQNFLGFFGFLFVMINVYRGITAIYNNQQHTILDNNLANGLWLLFFLSIAFIFPLCFLLINIEEANKELISTNETKDKFFRIIAHDVKEPISQMMIISQIFESSIKDIDNEQKIKLAKMMHTSSKRGLELLENLLTWSQCQTNSIEFQPELFEFKKIIDKTIKLLKQKAELKNIQINAKGILEGEIVGDKNMLLTVTRNLLSNAIKFTRNEGQIIVSTEFTAKNMIFSVSDNGVGMSEKVAKELFHIGSKHIGLGTNNERGSGIGLVLCKEFISKHNGKIWVQSKEGIGSRFQFSIPIQS